MEVIMPEEKGHDLSRPLFFTIPAEIRLKIYKSTRTPLLEHRHLINMILRHEALRVTGSKAIGAMSHLLN
jgi:hypothetical protein